MHSVERSEARIDASSSGCCWQKRSPGVLHLALFASEGPQNPKGPNMLGLFIVLCFIGYALSSATKVVTKNPKETMAAAEWVKRFISK
jgi:hypothetical protein